MAKQYGSNSPYPGDKINGKLEQGEYVMNRNVLEIPGMKKYLDKLNYEVAPRYAQGGEVNGYALGGLAAWSKSLFNKFKAPDSYAIGGLTGETLDEEEEQLAGVTEPAEYDPTRGSLGEDFTVIPSASEDYDVEAPQKMGLMAALKGYGEKAGQYGSDLKTTAMNAGIDAGGALSGAHQYLGAGKADDYQDVLTGKAKGNLYQRAGKGLGMLSSLMSEFAAPGQGRGNLKGYGRYKGGETPTLKDVAPSKEVKKADELEVKPEGQKLDLDKDISQEIIDRDKVVFEESIADDGVGLDYNEVGADTTPEERLRTQLHGGESTVNTGELTDESLGTGMSSESTSTSQDLDLSGGVSPELWTGSDIDYSLNPEEVEEKAGGGLIHRAYQNGGYAHANLDYMISLENHYQDGGMVSGNNSRRMFDFMKTRRH